MKISDKFRTKLKGFFLAAHLSEQDIFRAVLAYEDEANPYREWPLSVYVIIGWKGFEGQSVQNVKAFITMIQEMEKMQAQVVLKRGGKMDMSPEAVVAMDISNSATRITGLLDDDGLPVDNAINLICNRIDEQIERVRANADVWDDDKEIEVQFITREEFEEVKEKMDYGE